MKDGERQRDGEREYVNDDTQEQCRGIHRIFNTIQLCTLSIEMPIQYCTYTEITLWYLEFLLKTKMNPNIFT